jgi:predicted ATPase/class 3 adenylate cyclase
MAEPLTPLDRATNGRPSGHVAFLFTDLKGSTSAWEREPEAMNEVMARHDATLRSAIDRRSGAVFSIAGDAFGAAFHSIDDAVESVLSAQRGLAAHDWPSGLAPQVRMGLHVGRAFERDGNYFGPTVNRAARIMSAANGGQVLLSEEARVALHARPAGTDLLHLGQFHLRDLPEPIALYQLTIPDLPCDFPPLRALDQSPRIHRPAGTFIGREEEMNQLRWWLDTTTIITVVASGGIGKTRLAYELAAGIGNLFPDGVYAVELADGTTDDVVPRIAEAILGEDPVARAEGSTDLLAALQKHLATHRSLMVLDNCEHVLHHAATVVEALTTRCRGLTVLATSRERLGIPGEQVLPLAPLATKGSDGAVSPAAELFLDRALSADPVMPLDQATLDAIDRICATVDGSALAIELAATRVRTLTPQQIADRLDDALHLLRRGRSIGPERHRSLESAIAWSYDLLDNEERRMLAWSSVFVGGFDLDGAAVLAAAAEIDDVIGVVASLVEKSLLTTMRVGDGMRYRLPEPIRQFAHSRLEALGQRDRALLAHFEHCKVHAREVVQQLDGPVDPALFASLTAELDNFLVAMHRATERGDTGDAMALAASLDLYWAETGHLAVAFQTMDALVRSRPDNRNVPLVEVPMLWVATMCGELPRAQELRDEVSLLMAEGKLSPGLVGGAAFGTGFIESALGNAAAAAQVWAAAGKGAARFAPAVARQAYWSAGQSANAAGDLELAMSLYDAAEAIDGPAPGWFPTFIDVQRRVCRAYDGEDHVDRIDAGVAALENTGLRMRFLLAAAFAAMGLFRSGAGDRAEHWWKRSMYTGREIGNLWACWVMLECAAWSAMDARDDTLAARFWHAADAFATQRGYRLWPVLAQEGVARRTVLQARSPLAVTALDGVTPWSLSEAVGTALTTSFERSAR